MLDMSLFRHIRQEGWTSVAELCQDETARARLNGRLRDGGVVDLADLRMAGPHLLMVRLSAVPALLNEQRARYRLSGGQRLDPTTIAPFHQEGWLALSEVAQRTATSRNAPRWFVENGTIRPEHVRWCGAGGRTHLLIATHADLVLARSVPTAA